MTKNFTRLKPLFIAVFLLAFTLKVLSQKESACPEMDDSKAVELYKNGTDKRKFQKEQRMAFLKQALDLEPDYVEANFAYAEEMIKTAIMKQAPFAPTVPYFMTVVKQCPHYHSDPYYYIGFSYYEDEKYSDAITYLQKFLAFKDDDEKKFSKDYDGFIYEAKKMLQYAKFYNDIFQNPVPFDPYPVKDICTEHDEYLAAISPDNQYAYFTRKMPYTPSSINQIFAAETENKEFFIKSERQINGAFSVGAPMPSPFNLGENQGGPTITIDDKTIYFTICKDNGGSQPNCDLYFSNFQYGEWGDIANMGAQVNDPSAWDSQPSVSADGLTLYFASSRAGGMGKADIYKVVKDPKTGEWSSAINLGAPINTAGNEKSPFIHSDSHTLYFSSDGLMGIGGYDIFYSRADSANNWTKPVNIGYPINSTGDDLGFFVSTDGKTGFFCTNDANRSKGRGVGGWDVLQFNLYSKARPDNVAVRKGKISVPDGDPKGVTITVTNTKTQKKGAVMYDTVTGEYAIITSTKEPSVISVNKKGYSFISGVITPKDTFTGSPQIIDLQIKPIAVNSAYPLNNIYYNSNSALLEPISVSVIKEFAKFLKANPALKIKIAGYTDNLGNQNDNLALSKDRAFTVMQTIEEDSISSTRLTFQGYGPENPIANNSTEEGRQKNRRTEFIILDK